MSVSLAKWATNWQKDPRFSKNYTARLIEKACALDALLDNAYRNGTLKVIAGHMPKGQEWNGTQQTAILTPQEITSENMVL